MSRLFERNTAWCRSLTGERACENHANARRKALAVASGERARLRTDAAVREAALRIQNTRCGTTRFTTPLGGTADLGQDAVAERFFGQAGSQRTV